LDAGARTPALPISFSKSSPPSSLSHRLTPWLLAATVEVACIVGSRAMPEWDSGCSSISPRRIPNPHHSSSPLPSAGLIPGMESAHPRPSGEHGVSGYLPCLGYNDVIANEIRFALAKKTSLFQIWLLLSNLYP
jgi:hypothetical protein